MWYIAPPAPPPLTSPAPAWEHHNRLDWKPSHILFELRREACLGRSVFHGLCLQSNVNLIVQCNNLGVSPGGCSVCQEMYSVHRMQLQTPNDFFFFFSPPAMVPSAESNKCELESELLSAWLCLCPLVNKPHLSKMKHSVLSPILLLE